MDIKIEDSSMDRTFHEIVVESIDTGIMATDCDGTLLSINRAAEKMWDFPRETAIGNSFLLALDDNDRSRMEKTFNYVMRTGRTVRASDIVFVNRSGKTLYINAYASPFKYESGKKIGVAMWTEDITEERKLKMEVQRADKLSALGQLALGIAHEVRTPLGSIKALASLIELNLQGDKQLIKYLSVLSHEVNRLDQLSRGLLDFGGNRNLNIEAVNINDIIRKVLFLAQLNRSSSNVKIEESLQEDLPEILGDREYLLHALMNLVLNAFDAISVEGTIWVKTYHADKWVHISIRDTGVGIGSRNINKIFDPFYTTKENGTGLGLSVVHTIITDHGGNIDLESQSNVGTTFFIKLPATVGRHEDHV